MLQNLREGYGDGMVFVSFNFTPENISIVNSCSRPVVLTNNYPENPGDQFDSVYIDTFEGIAMACRHFIAQGIRDIGYIGGVPSAQTGRERQNGYISALEKAGIPLTPDWIQEGDFSRASGEEAMRRLSGLDKLPEAIVVANDLMAIGALQVCRELNIRVPEDLAIIGMDDIDSAQLLGLSSIQMLEDEIGRNAAELLMDRIINGSRPRKTIRLLPKLSIRASSEKKNA
jgi:LacI family transcriptional regulator